MDPTLFITASKELRERFFTLLDTLSAVQALATLDVQHRDTACLLGDALNVLMQHQDLERCSAFLLEDGELTCVAGTDLPKFFLEDTSNVVTETQQEARKFKIGEGLIGIAAETGRLQLCGNCSTDPRFEAGDKGEENSLGSLMCAPILNGDKVLGVINVHHPGVDYFQDWHQHTLFMFCGILGHMLANHNVMQRLEEAVDKRTRQLESALLEAERLTRRYEELSTIDELTGLHNRRFFFPETEAALSRAARHKHEFCLMVMDLDFFKRINDAYGHATGDRVLCGIAETLKSHTRDGDILARLGGEEFVLALPNTEIGGAKSLAERIRHQIQATEWLSNENRFRITACIGLACLDQEISGDDRSRLEEILRRADKALYYCKYHGRDQVQNYQDVLNLETKTI